MNTTNFRYLFYVTRPYSFPILQPIQDVIEEDNTNQVRWFVTKSSSQYKNQEKELKSSEEVILYNPDIVIAPGNTVPHFWPGLKVQIFHGLDDEVKGFYRITGFFDLYCTPGPRMTERFKILEKKHKHFLIKETGWPKLDIVFKNKWEFLDQKNQLIEQFGFNPQLPVLLYAPTFPPKYTSAPDLFNSISNLKNGKYNWIIKFHCLMKKSIQKQYKNLECENLKTVDELNILPLMAGSDIMITDTSSVAYEFLPFDRPLVTYQAIARKNKGINVQNPTKLASAIVRSLNDPTEFSSNRKSCLQDIHPYSDGNSSKRVVESVEEILLKGSKKNLKPKPRNLVRKFQIWKKIYKEKR